MSYSQPIPWGQLSNPNAENFMGVEYDHEFWLEDAARIARFDAWPELNAEHIRHLLSEITNLKQQIDQLRPVDPDPPF